jgi:DNA processing protein
VNKNLINNKYQGTSTKDQGTTYLIFHISYFKNLSLQHQIALTLIPKVGCVLARNLVSYCGGVEEVFKAKKSELIKIPNIGEQLAKSILGSEVMLKAEAEIKFLDRYGIQSHFYLDKNYPSRLKHYDDMPVMLYYKGNAPLNHGRIVSIVGTRTPTEQGKLFTKQLIEDLQKYNVLIASGLAYGIDGAAHRACVEHKVPTIGVLGHGLKTVYPPEHNDLAKEMVTNGGLLTEHCSETEIRREHFPMRNRIIAAMCDAVVVVETGIKGGSMISAYQANEYNKDVFAVPGRLKDPFSKGCNHLIKTHKASLLESADDIAYLLRWDKTKPTVQAQLFVELSTEEQEVYNILKTREVSHLEQLIAESGKSTSVINVLLLEMEFKGVIKSLAGRRFIVV